MDSAVSPIAKLFVSSIRLENFLIDQAEKFVNFQTWCLSFCFKLFTINNRQKMRNSYFDSTEAIHEPNRTSLSVSAEKDHIFGMIKYGKQCCRNLVTQVKIAGRGNRVPQIPRHVNSGERGDVPGWVLVVLMTAGLVTGIWTVAAPRLNQILRTSLDSMNSIR